MKNRQFLTLALCLGLLFLSASFAITTVSADGVLAGEKICLDPGHGGEDPGAVNTVEGFLLKESDINLDVAYGIKALLEGSGADVVLTRTDDSYKDNEDRYDFCNNEKATLLISVHTNSVTDPVWDGSMALYFHPNDGDRILAQSIYDVMYPLLKESAPDPDNFRSFGLDWFASGVLFKSDMPATMMEPVFMSNPAEAALLVQPIYDDLMRFDLECANFDCRRGEVAQAIHQGILSYFDSTIAGNMHVAVIDMSFDKKARKYFVHSQIEIQDDAGAYVPEANISASIKQPDGTIVFVSESSDIDGLVTFTIRSSQIGMYAITVTDVEKNGWVYDATANIETSDFLIIP